MPLDNITTPAGINASGQMVNFVKTMRFQSLPKSLYGQSRQTPKTRISPKGHMQMTEAPQELFVDVGDKFVGGNVSVNFEMLASLSQDGASGTATVRGNGTYEEGLVFKFFRATANMRRKAIPLDGDGVAKHALSGYTDKEMYNNLLSAWVSDDVEFGIRHSICEGVPPWLEAAPASVTTKIHPNVFCAGVADGDQPTYSKTAATWADRVGQAAAGIPASVEGGLSYKVLAKLEEQVSDKFILDLGWSKGPGKLLSISRRGYNQLINDPKVHEIFEHADVRGSMNQLFTGVVGPICGFYLWVDDRLPRIAVSGAGTKTIAFTYWGHGRTDNRVGTLDCNIVHGAGSIMRGNMIAPHFINDDEDYGIINGLGISRTECIIRPQYDLEAASTTDTSIEVDGTALLITRRDV